MSERYDVIIIGTGAAGGTLAHQLAPSGKRMLLLERGGWLPREVENWHTAEVLLYNRYISPDTWYDESGKAVQPQVHYFVGGATKLYGAALYRLRKMLGKSQTEMFRGEKPIETAPVRSRHLRARPELPGTRARQPVRGRHQLLPQHRRGEPCPDRDGQRHPGGRSSPRAAGRGGRGPPAGQP